MSDLESMVSEWRKSTSHKEKAMMEDRMRTSLSVRTRELTAILDGASTYELQAHHTFLLSKSSYIWSLLDAESVRIADAKRILHTSRRLSKTLGRELDDVMREVYLDGQRDAGPKAESVQAASWDLVRDALESIVSKELSVLHEMERKAELERCMVDVDVLLRQMKVRIRTRARTGMPKAWEAGSERQERRKFNDALRELGMDPPRSGRLPDMDEVRRTHRRVSADHHPDRQKGLGAVEKFQRVNDAYRLVCEYVEAKKGT